MKKIKLLLAVCLCAAMGFSQNPISKRIKINNPTRSQLLKVKDAGIDLSCGAVFTNNSLVLEVGEGELQLLDSQNLNYSVLIDDLIDHYRKKTEVELPLAKAQLQAKKLQRSTNKSLSTKSEAIDNFIQYEGCSEVNWAVPNNFNLGSMGGCLTYSEVLAELDQMRALYPNLISVKTDASPTNQVTHGNSFTNNGQYDAWSGSTIYYVRISDNPDVDEPNEPESLYSGMTHSREVSSLMNLMYYMWYLLENYDTDPGIKNLVDNHEMYFIPVANPDGLLWNEQIAPSGGGLQRKNLGPYNTGNNDLRGVDLNRNYDYFWGPNPIYGGSSGTQSSNIYRGPSAFSEPETQIVRDFSATRNFKTAMNHHATSNLIPHAYNGYPNAPASGREAEYQKFCHDMTRFNRYIYGEAPDILTIANGDMSDWMLGGVADVNGSTGSGQSILALAPENGSWISSDGEGSFWPNATKIVEIAQRAVRMNFVNAYHSGKFAQFHDLNASDITSTSGSLEFGIEYLGQTLGDITLNVTPVSSNITSITPPATQSGWSKLEQRTVTAAYTLDANIQPNEEIEFQVTLSNDDGYVMYQANIIKLYNPTVLFSDNPDINNLGNWTASGGSWGVTSDAYSGSAAITDSPSGAYGNNQSKTLTLNTSVNLSSATATVVQFFAKWDLERNFDYVQIEGSTNGSTWIPLCGKYTKPGSSISTNRYSSGNSSNTSTGKSTSDQNNQPTGESLYDSNTMNKWVLEEILIDATENSFLFGATNAQFRFVFDSDNTNRADGYPTVFDGFTFDDFKVTSVQTPCVISVPVNTASSNVTETEATITWDNIASATYDLRYREVGSQNWTDVNGLSTPNYDITGLTNVTDYEVQVRSNCSTNSSAYSSVITFTTLDVQLNYCASASTNVNDEFISRVQLNTINNTSGAQFYSDFTNISTSLEKGTQYTITITPTWTGQVYTEAYSVWIDYNRDGDFEDAGEQVFTQSPTNASSVSGSFTVPASAVENSTRMRVSMQYNAIPTSCQTFQYGEVEDYTIIIEGAGPDVTPPVITLNGASPVSVTIGGTYSEEGATATDNIDGDISANIVVGGDTVNTNTLGSYVVTYDVSDAAGNAATQVTRTVNIVDAIPGCSGGITAFPYAEGFEGSIGDWSQSSADDLDWLVISNNTPSNNTGPSGAVEGSSYIYVEASGNGTGYPNKRAIINSPCFDLSNATGADFSFQYHMFGAADMGTIDLEISNDDGASWVSIWNQSGNQGNSWFAVNLDLSTYAGGSIQLRFNRFVGSTWQADIAIDDINLTIIEEDTTAPVITLIGASSIDLDVGGTYTEQGATATDNIDGDISASIVIGGDVVDTNIAGNYLVTYNVSDAAGNAATQVTRTVNVIPDTTAPVITLIGASSIDLNVGGTYNEQGATATDNIDGDISASIVIGGDVVDTNIAGNYLVTYNVSDAAGNAATQVTRTVNVIPDTTAPVITLIGASSIDLDVGGTYTEQGATATDNIDGDISASIVIGGDVVDTNIAGNYLVTYNVSDAAGNAATQVTRTVNVIPDTTAPVITLIGASSIDLDVGGTYTEQGATATDNIDGDISASIVIGGDVVDTNIAGTYVVTYNVSDAAGNAATQVTRTVNVIPDTTAPVITLIGASSIDLDVGGTYTEQGATATDNIDGDISASIVIGGDVVDTNIAGTYVVTYNVSDAAGNAATQVTRTVNVNAIPTDVLLHQGFFETGLDGWTDGGSDCARLQDTRSYEGIYSVRIRDNSGTASAMTYSNVDITGFAEVQVNFYFYVVSMENNEDFWLRYYNGSSWTTIETWARGIDINNNTFYNATVVIPASVYNFASNSGFRFQCDASGNNDQIFIDQVTITGLSSASGSNNTLTNLGGTTKTGTDKYFNEEEEFIVYPNPVKGIELNVFVPGTDIFDFKIINMLGQIVAEGKSEGKIMVDRIESGVYIIEVNDGDELMTKRFIKE